MATTVRVNEYLHQLRAQHQDDGYIPRAFRTAEEWEKWSDHDWHGHRFGREPGLDSLLENRTAIVLGEPGSGKSTVAGEATRLATDRGWVPVLLRLREFRGDLRSLVANAIPADVLTDAQAAPPLPVLYVLDGLDEVGEDLITPLLEDLKELERGDSASRVLLTSRQAFF